MPRLQTRTINSAPARCRRCNEIAQITIREMRYVRSWFDLFASDFHAAVTRTASCEGCGTTYPVRSTDDSAAPAAARSVTPDNRRRSDEARHTSSGGRHRAP